MRTHPAVAGPAWPPRSLDHPWQLPAAGEGASESDRSMPPGGLNTVPAQTSPYISSVQNLLPPPFPLNTEDSASAVREAPLLCPERPSGTFSPSCSQSPGSQALGFFSPSRS